MKTAFVIGSGPAGLMAAEELARAGAQVTVCDGKPSLGRKFLMAGKSGLNLTKHEPLNDFVASYSEARSWLAPMLAQFGPEQVMSFARGLEQPVFTGSSGRVFPDAMKASPFLRAWIMRLSKLGVRFQTKWQWIGWHEKALVFETPDGPCDRHADAVVFALGGASWAKLGSDGTWSKLFVGAGIALTAFGPSNAAVSLDWSEHMRPFFGTPLKAVKFSSGPFVSRGEAIISARGLEGGGIYSVSRGVREGHPLVMDLRPDWTHTRIETALERPRGKASMSNHLRRVLGLKKHELALLNEYAHPLPKSLQDIAKAIKTLTLRGIALRPIDEAISTSGGVSASAINEDLMLLAKPGHFCAGEMLDWEAPTGGYLITACLATGRTAGRGAARFLGL